jgi:uroporphyrinogen-III synthase
LSDATTDTPAGVLITRPEPAASATASLLRERGYTPYLAPMMAIVASPPFAPAAAQAVLATSANAIPALDRLDRDTLLFAVGDATARHAQATGFTDVRSASGDAQALAALVAATLAPADGALLLASGRGQGLELAARLRGLGYRVRRRIAYRRVAARHLPSAALDALRGGEIGHVLFYSADTARIFVDCLRGHEALMTKVDALAISAQTAQALGAVAWRSISVANHPNQDELVALLP